MVCRISSSIIFCCSSFSFWRCIRRICFFLRASSAFLASSSRRRIFSSWSSLTSIRGDGFLGVSITTAGLSTTFLGCGGGLGFVRIYLINSFIFDTLYLQGEGSCLGGKGTSSIGSGSSTTGSGVGALGVGSLTGDGVLGT